VSHSHGFREDARSGLLRARPPRDAIAWVERSLEARVTSIRAVKGGTSSAVHVVRVSSPRGVESVILRRYVVPEVNLEEPDIAAREAHALQFLSSTDVLAPSVLAVDTTGAEAGVPTVLMSRVPGRLDWAPNDVAEWLRGLASVLPVVHAVPLTPGHRFGDFRPYAPSSWDPPPWMQRPALWDRAIGIFHGPSHDNERVLVHRDYHPGNVLWRRRRVTGVVDWESASIGPPSVDASWCRVNLIGQFDLDIGDRFVGIWEQISGRRHHPWADVVLLVDAMSWSGPRSERGRGDMEHALARGLAELAG